MNRKTFYLIQIFTMLIVIFACQKKDPCDGLKDGVYEFPQLPENHNMSSFDEFSAFYAIPIEIMNCMETEGLVNTILQYPELYVMHAGANLQSGYDLLVKKRFNGISELESRDDRGSCLLKKYKLMDPMDFDDSMSILQIGERIIQGISLEVIVGQYINLNPLTSIEVNELLLKCLAVYDAKIDNSEHHGYSSAISTAVIMARLMLINNYEPFVSLYHSDPAIGRFTEFYEPVLSSIIVVNDLAKDYKDSIKN